jgi:hypothetical protein
MGNGERVLACGEMACMRCGRLQGGGDRGGWWLAQVGDGECGMGVVASSHGYNGRTPWRAHHRSVAVCGRVRSESVAVVGNGVPLVCAHERNLGAVGVTQWRSAPVTWTHQCTSSYRTKDSIARDVTLDHVVIAFWSHDPREFPKILSSHDPHEYELRLAHLYSKFESS